MIKVKVDLIFIMLQYTHNHSSTIELVVGTPGYILNLFHN